MMLLPAALAVFTVAADPLCQTEEDCSLAGECVQGRCVCDGWTHGEHCEVLNLVPADPERPGYRSLETNSWGGSSIKVGDKWFLFYSQIDGGCPLDGYWSQHCEMWRAESDHPMGPWSNATRIIGSEAHNVKPYIAPDGTILVYYIGETNNETVECNGTVAAVAGTTPPPTDYPVPIPVEAGGPIMILSSAAGPNAAPSEWKKHGPMTDSYGWHSATNPSIWFNKNGSVNMMVCRRFQVRPPDGKAGYDHKWDWIMYADTWAGPYKNVTQSINDSLATIGNIGEDPDVFKTPRGFHQLGHNSGPSSSHLVWSKDGVHYHKTDVHWGNAFNASLVWSNGTVSNLCRRQRPRVIMAEDGLPGWLWTAVQSREDGGGDCLAKTRTWTSVQQIGRNFSR